MAHLFVVQIEKPEKTNFILGQSHFIKTVDDLHEALVSSVPDIKFGLAFCEASGPRLVRLSGTDKSLIDMAKKNSLALGCGHSFIIFFGPDVYPLNVLNAVKMVPEVCRVFCATANPTQVMLVSTNQGRGILGVVDGQVPLGTETDDDVKKRKEFLRTSGYRCS